MSKFVLYIDSTDGAPAPKASEKEALLAVVNEEVERFSTYMATLGDWKSAGPLNEMEKTLIRTYLVQKFTGKLDEVRSDGTR
jgi:hypothetical protein